MNEWLDGSRRLDDHELDITAVGFICASTPSSIHSTLLVGWLAGWLAGWEEMKIRFQLKASNEQVGGSREWS